MQSISTHLDSTFFFIFNVTVFAFPEILTLSSMNTKVLRIVHIFATFKVLTNSPVALFQFTKVPVQLKREMEMYKNQSTNTGNYSLAC